jgi:sugar phosphate isomerase/epimerase
VARGEDPLPILEKVIERVCCVHAADTDSIGMLKPVLLGTGEVPFSRIFSVLKRFGYAGWISIEEASGLGRRGVEEAVAYVRRLWDALGPE